MGGEGGGVGEEGGGRGRRGLAASQLFVSTWLQPTFSDPETDIKLAGCTSTTVRNARGSDFTGYPANLKVGYRISGVPRDQKSGFPLN